MPHGPSRREFLGSLAAFALFPLEQEKPELILYNANILTMNGTEPRAQAVAIAGGRFLAVGSNSDVLNLAGPGARKLDLDRKSTRLNSSHLVISYAVFCLKKKKRKNTQRD